MEINKFASFSRRPRGVMVCNENKMKKEALRVEMEGVVKRLEEFRKGMRCLMDCIEGKGIGDLGVMRVYDECNGRKMRIFFIIGVGFNFYQESVEGSKMGCLFTGLGVRF